MDTKRKGKNLLSLAGRYYFLPTQLAGARIAKEKIAFAEMSMNELSEKDKGSVGHNDKLGIWLGM